MTEISGKNVKPCLLLTTKHKPHVWGITEDLICTGIPDSLPPLSFAFRERPKIGWSLTDEIAAAASIQQGLAAAANRAPQPSLDGEQRLAELRDEAWGKFLEGYREYGEGAADELGVAGQWGDLYRKIKKLKVDLWLGETHLSRETPREVLMDIIGHALLALDMIDRNL